MSSSQDQTPRDPRTGSQAAAPPRDTAGQAGQYVPRPAPQYDDTTQRYEETAPTTAAHGAAIGFTMMAAVLMMLSGAWNFLEGLAAILRGSFFVVLPNFVYNLSVTGWGWFHLITGAVVFIVGAALLTDKAWARAAGVVVAALSAIINFLYIPYLAWWSAAIIALDLIIIWALLSPRRGGISGRTTTRMARHGNVGQGRERV